MMREAGLEVEPIDVTPDSPEVLELVGEVAEPVFGWTLEQSQPAGNPRRRKNGNGGADGERSGRPNRSGGRNKDRGKDKGGKPFKSERKDRRDRDQREERNDNAKKFEPKQNRAERRAAKFEGRDNREFEAREHRWEHPEIQEERRDQREEKRNNKRREKYARLHEQQRSDNEQRETSNKRRNDDDYGNTDNRRKPGRKKAGQLAKSRVRQVRSSASRKLAPNADMTTIVVPRARSVMSVSRMRNVTTVIRKPSVVAVANVTTSMPAVPPSPCEHQKSAVPHALIAEKRKRMKR